VPGCRLTIVLTMFRILWKIKNLLRTSPSVLNLTPLILHTSLTAG
jgi:hypothetical protein